MNEIRASAFPFKQIITVEPRSRAVIRTAHLRHYSTLRILCSVEEGEAVGVAGGAMKLVGSLLGKGKDRSEAGVSDIEVMVFTPDDTLYSPEAFSRGWGVTGSRTIEIPVRKTAGEWFVVLNNEESKVTQKIVNLTLEEVSWKDGPPIELSGEIPAREWTVILLPVESGDKIRFNLGVVSSDIDFYLVSQDNIVGDKVAVNFAYMKRPKTSTLTEIYECTQTENLAVVLDNRSSKFKSKSVNLTVRLEAAVSESAAPSVEVLQAPVQKETIKETVKEVYLVVCPHCGHKNEMGNRFCGKCGASI